MDSTLRDLMNTASIRGNKYVKGDVGIAELPEKMAELGVLLLEKARKISELDNGEKREELNEIQNKLDDLRKAVFASKFIQQ